jgi:nucleoid-associated protein YgaU
MGIFDQIKNAFGSRDEPLPEQEKPAPEAAAAPADEAAEALSYTVEAGDTLWKVAERVYGDGSEYQRIFEANRDLLDSPDHILPGLELKFP